MIVPEKNIDKAFCKLKYNDDQKYKNSTVYFNSNLLDYNLGIGRVYILTSEFTASASEAVLNGLKAANYMEVIQMGSTTEGKNLGSVEYDSEKYDWILNTIVSSIVNADDFGDYFNGITPDAQYYWDDININEYGYQYMGDLGSDDDPLIYNALENMGISLDNASSQRRQISKSDSYDFGNVKRTGSYVLNKKYNSVIID